MTRPDRGHAMSLAIGALAVGLSAVWLWRGPSLIAGLIGVEGGSAAEAVFTILMFAPLLGLALAGAALTGITPWLSGERPWIAAGRGAAIGLSGLLLATGYAALAGTLHRGAGGGAQGVLILGLLVVAMQAGTEEVLFRGWLQPLVARRTGVRASILFVAAIFALLHALAGGVDALFLFNTLLGGLLFGLLAARDAGIAGAAAAHFAYNAAEQLLVGLDPNPGTGGFGAVINLDLSGAVRWGGSDAGLNASWAMTIALVAILVPLALRWRTVGRASRAATA